MIKNRYYALFFALSLAFGVVYIKYMYSYIFHADASAMQVLAQAMVDTKSFITHDFYYGNQLIFLRSSSTIALALALGYSAYNAFIAGSALSIAIWATVCLYCINSAIKNPKLALLLTVCVLFPISSSYDGDYILGQQSHLANVVCSLSFVVFLYKYLSESIKKDLALSILFICLISIETPIRGAFVALTAMIAINLFFKNNKSIPATIVIVAAMVVSYVINKSLLIHFGIAQDIISDSKLMSLDAIVDNIKFISHDYLIASSPMNLLGGRRILSFASLFYFCGLAYLITITFYMISKIYSGVKEVVSLKKQENFDFFDFIKVIAGIGLVVTVSSILILNPDSSRHAIWAFFILKLCFFYDAYNYIYARKIKFSMTLLLIFVSLSSSFFNYVIFNTKNYNHVYFSDTQSSIKSIESLMKENNVKYIYSSSFWSVMPLSTLVKGINTGVIIPSDSNLFVPFRWLTRPSTYNRERYENVFYLIGDDQDGQALLRKITSEHAVMLSKTTFGEIWMSKPVWVND